jgi:hypothetical protein
MDQIEEKTEKELEQFLNCILGFSFNSLEKDMIGENDIHTR